MALAKTSDAGSTWQRLHIPATQIRVLRFIDESVGWATGFVVPDVPSCQKVPPAGANPCRGVVVRTQDGGQTWQEVLSIPGDGFYAEPVQQLQAVDGLLAWALTLAPGPCTYACSTDLRRTTDGGKTWTTLLHGNIAAIRFASASRGWIALDDLTGAVEVRFTTDGGNTWATGFRTTSGNVHGLDAATVQTAWLLTRSGGYCSASDCSKYELFRTVDGGISWSSLGNPKDFACSGGHLVGPLFASVSRGWLALSLGAGGVNVGPGGLLQTEDGGKTWLCTNTPQNTNLVSAADPLHLWVTSETRGGNEGTNLFASDDGGTTWHAVDLSSIGKRP
jgi:photosystem II stability/assembly factor-like uncharacterized protein